MSRTIVFVVGSNRTGTSLLTEKLLDLGFQIPQDVTSDSTEYPTYESARFKAISRKWNWEQAERFIDSLPEGRVVLKYPKASYRIRRWIRLVPDAKLIYVFRPREEAVQSQLQHWWGDRPFKFLIWCVYTLQWIRGYLAISNLPIQVWITTFATLKSSEDFQVPMAFLNLREAQI
ncbi:sulfotransferase [Rhodopirellula sp. JC639]|uniref:sulfotransferase n=1 Tax=Stieleria mannarensis TaxID=2755585 RepID=UPI0016000A79|nr:sulfotransferase [Rhodopirellula sp. JC639]